MRGDWPDARRLADAVSSQLRRLHRVDLGKMPRDAGPAIAFVAAQPQLAARRAEIEPDGIARIRCHRLTLHRPPGLLLRQAASETLPAFAAIARGGDPGNAARAGARPDRRA